MDNHSLHTTASFAPENLLLGQGGTNIRVTLSPERITRQYFRHSPPSPVELENAIQDVEDSLLPAYNRLGSGALLVAETQLHGLAEFLPSPETAGIIPRDDLEAGFSRFAALSEGRPLSQDPLPQDPLFAATLLIIRELMHHLDFRELRTMEG